MLHSIRCFYLPFLYIMWNLLAIFFQLFHLHQKNVTSLCTATYFSSIFVFFRHTPQPVMFLIGWQCVCVCEWEAAGLVLTGMISMVTAVSLYNPFPLTQSWWRGWIIMVRCVGGGTLHVCVCVYVHVRFRIPWSVWWSGWGRDNVCVSLRSCQRL